MGRSKSKKEETFFDRVLKAHRTRLKELKEKKETTKGVYWKRYQKAAKDVERLFGAPPYVRGSNLAKEAVVAIENYIMNKRSLKYGNASLRVSRYGLSSYEERVAIPGWPKDWLSASKRAIREYCRQAAIQLVEAFHDAHPEWPIQEYEWSGHRTGPFPHVSARAEAGTFDKIVSIHFIWAKEA